MTPDKGPKTVIALLILQCFFIIQTGWTAPTLRQIRPAEIQQPAQQQAPESEDLLLLEDPLLGTTSLFFPDYNSVNWTHMGFSTLFILPDSAESQDGEFKWQNGELQWEVGRTFFTGERFPSGEDHFVVTINSQLRPAMRQFIVRRKGSKSPFPKGVEAMQEHPILNNELEETGSSYEVIAFSELTASAARNRGVELGEGAEIIIHNPEKGLNPYRVVQNIFDRRQTTKRRPTTIKGQVRLTADTRVAVGASIDGGRRFTCLTGGSQLGVSATVICSGINNCKVFGRVEDSRLLRRKRVARGEVLTAVTEPFVEEVEVPPTQAQRQSQNAALLAQAGYALEGFGPDTRRYLLGTDKELLTKLIEHGYNLRQYNHLIDVTKPFDNSLSSEVGTVQVTEQEAQALFDFMLEYTLAELENRGYYEDDIEARMREILKDKDFYYFRYRLVLKAIKSKMLIDSIEERTKLSITIPVVLGRDVWSRPIEVDPFGGYAGVGLDAFRTKIKDLLWLLGDNENIKCLLIVVDDGDPAHSVEIARQILRQDFPQLLDPEHGRIYVDIDYLDEAIVENRKRSPVLRNPALSGMESADDSQKGGAFAYGFMKGVRWGADYLLLNDADVTYSLLQMGELMRPALGDQSVGMVAVSREHPETLIYRDRTEAQKKRAREEGRKVMNLLPIGKRLDTQAGYKLMTRAAAEKVIQRMTSRHIYFDSELMLRTLMAGYEVKEVGVVCLGVREFALTAAANAAGRGTERRIAGVTEQAEHMVPYIEYSDFRHLCLTTGVATRSGMHRIYDLIQKTAAKYGKPVPFYLNAPKMKLIFEEIHERRKAEFEQYVEWLNAEFTKDHGVGPLAQFQYAYQRQKFLDTLKATYNAEMKRLRREFNNKPFASGTELALRITSLNQKFFEELFAFYGRSMAFKTKYPIAVFAGGSFKRHEMSSSSDVDLTVLGSARAERDRDYEAMLERMRIERIMKDMRRVDFPVHMYDYSTVAQTIARSSDSTIDLSNVAEHRYLVGKESLDRELMTAIDEVHREMPVDVKGQHVLFEMLNADEYHARCPGYDFEYDASEIPTDDRGNFDLNIEVIDDPDIKRGQGGLRDIARLQWLGTLVDADIPVGRFSETAEVLIEKGLITRKEADEIIEALDFMLLYLNEAHFQLTEELQELIAQGHLTEEEAGEISDAGGLKKHLGNKRLYHVANRYKAFPFDEIGASANWTFAAETLIEEYVARGETVAEVYDKFMNRLIEKYVEIPTGKEPGYVRGLINAARGGTLKLYDAIQLANHHDLVTNIILAWECKYHQVLNRIFERDILPQLQRIKSGKWVSRDAESWVVTMALVKNKFSPSNILRILGDIPGHSKRDYRLFAARNTSSPVNLLLQRAADGSPYENAAESAWLTLTTGTRRQGNMPKITEVRAEIDGFEQLEKAHGTERALAMLIDQRRPFAEGDIQAQPNDEDDLAAVQVDTMVDLENPSGQSL